MLGGGVFLISLNNLSQKLNQNQEEIYKTFENIQNRLQEGKHYLKNGNDISLTKSGLIRFSLLSKSDKLLNFIEDIDEESSENIDSEVDNIFRNVEKLLKNIADDMVQNRENYDIEKIDKFVDVFNKFLYSREIIYNSNPNNQKKGNFLDSLSNFTSETRDTAYKFASKTEDDAYKFASEMGKDAYNFTSKTRDKAHDFVMKTEDDAYKFASNMGKDAYRFASKGMDYGYRFASKGMQYGYEFASKGEEVGEMANRILWMASEIGIMADRIGEMADRIVHTEHLIVQTAILIQNFGLLIDGTIKHMSESILYSLTLLLDKEFKPLQTTDKHLDIISDITKEIIKNNHEYDMAVLQKQQELRNITISALDKIEKGY